MSEWLHIWLGSRRFPVHCWIPRTEKRSVKCCTAQLMFSTFGKKSRILSMNFTIDMNVWNNCVVRSLRLGCILSINWRHIHWPSLGKGENKGSVFVVVLIVLSWCFWCVKVSMSYQYNETLSDEAVKQYQSVDFCFPLFPFALYRN